MNLICCLILVPKSLFFSSYFSVFLIIFVFLLFMDLPVSFISGGVRLFCELKKKMYPNEWSILWREDKTFRTVWWVTVHLVAILEYSWVCMVSLVPKPYESTVQVIHVGAFRISVLLYITNYQSLWIKWEIFRLAEWPHLQDFGKYV